MMKNLSPKLNDGHPPREIFAGINDVVWRWLNLEGINLINELGDYLPSIPQPANQNATASKGQSDLAYGFNLYQAYRRLFLEHGGEFNDHTKVLDFGCGWGRLIRFFIRDVSPQNLFGTDITEQDIKTCQATNRWASFSLNDVSPPLNYLDQSFDLIYAHSVFSHLPEALTNDWVNDFNRLLKPGGMLIFSTLKRDFFGKVAKWLHQDKLQKWQNSACIAFDNVGRHIAAYDRGEFCYGSVDQPNYGYAAIPQAYIEKHWTRIFQDVQFLSQVKGCAQAMIVCKKVGD